MENKTIEYENFWYPLYEKNEITFDLESFQSLKEGPVEVDLREKKTFKNNIFPSWKICLILSTLKTV